MNKYYESHLEEATLEWLKELGYDIVFAPEVAPDGAFSERATYGDVFLADRLKDALVRLNPDLPQDAINEAYRKIAIPQNPGLLINNHGFHRMLTDGVDIQVKQKDASYRTDKAYLFDFVDPKNNEFVAMNQFTVVENGVDKRPDVVIFVNGLPLVVFELKSASEEKVSISDAFNQIQTYKNAIPSLFVYNAFCVISDGFNAKAGTISSGEDRFMRWRTVDGLSIAPDRSPQLEILIRGMFEKSRLLDIIQNFILFNNTGSQMTKMLAGYHQYHAVNKAIDCTRAATQANGDRRIGVVWHTQGSGKSLSMVFYAAKLIQMHQLENPTIVVITDRNDLDNQLFSTFSSCRDILRNTPIQAEDRNDLRDLLNTRTSGGIIFTTIHKFANPEDPNVSLSNRRNIIVIADEAHRTQYGFGADIKEDDQEAVIRYGYAKYMRDALPNASYIGFTGTPVESTDKNTRAVFGEYIDVYDMTRAVEDKNTVRIYYESRIARVELSENIRPFLDDEYDSITEFQEETQKERLKSKWAKLEAIVGVEKRINQVAEDIVKHFEKHQENQTYAGGKAMIVVMSRRIAIALYKAITKIRPDWHNDELMKGKIKVVMTGSSSDPAEWQPYIGTKATREQLAARMKDVDDELQIAIVRDMWLTGFDVPSLNTMYVDKPMRGHNLMQAIARVNRVFRDKRGGLVVDYIGIADCLKKALSDYTENDQNITGVDTSVAVDVMMDKLDLIHELLHPFDFSRFFSGSSGKKMQVIVETMDYILGLREKRKKDYINFVTELCRAYSICSTTEEAKAVNVEIAFHKVVKAGLIKTLSDSNNKKTEAQLDAELNQLISKSISSNEVVDILQSAGLNRPDISILSDEFLAEVKDMKHRNLAVELLNRLLKGKIIAFARRNLVKSLKFSEMLENSILKYQNRAIETAQVIFELIELAKKMQEEIQKAEASGLSTDEVAFYDALAENKTALEVMGDDQLRKIAIELVSAIKSNLTVDWAIRDSVQANMRVIIKRLLKKYGYPPDDPKEPNNYQKSVDIIMQQTRITCEELGV